MSAAELTIERRLDRIESRFAIGDLVSDYCHGVDKRDLDRFLDIWHEDAVWEIGPPFGNFAGKSEIKRALTDLIWPAWRETHHWTTNLVVRFLDDDHAEGVCDVNCTGADPQDVMQIVAATYTDRYERRDGRWRIARRHVEMFYFSQVPGVDLVPPTYG